MRGLLPALLLLLAVARGAAEDEPEPDDAELDDDSDSAPFMIVVEHEEAGGGAGWRCSGSLVSLRTGVTSAECARGRARRPARELWALAAGAAAGLAPRADGARRVSRVATAGARGGSSAWSHALLDLAVIELEMPFGSGAHTRPILMATQPAECAGGGLCHMVRSLPRGAGPGGRVRLRIVDARLAPDAPCAQRVRYWAALRERALCLTGPVLCQSEWGAGVVCGGKLCGVVSRSAPAGAVGAGGAEHCGDTHAAQAVARWRRFLHCAHTLRACGRGACAELCNERQLLDDSGAVADSSEETVEYDTAAPPAPAASPGAPPPPPPAPPAASTAVAAVHTPFDLAHLAPFDDMDHDRTSEPVAEAPTRRLEAARLAAHTGSPPPRGRKPTRTAHSAATHRVRPPPCSPAPHSPPPPLRSPPQRPPPQVPPPQLPPPPRPPPPAHARALSAAPRRPALSVSEQSTALSAASHRPTPLFEPNRPDFRSGEYGDNAAEYGAPGEDAGAAASTAAAAAPRASSGSPSAAVPSKAPLPHPAPPPPAPGPPPPPPRAAPASFPREHPVAASPDHSSASKNSELALPILLVLVKSFV